MRQFTKKLGLDGGYPPLGPHETVDILAKQIEGKLPIGPAAYHATPSTAPTRFFAKLGLTPSKSSDEVAAQFDALVNGKGGAELAATSPAPQPQQQHVLLQSRPGES